MAEVYFVGWTLFEVPDSPANALAKYRPHLTWLKVEDGALKEAFPPECDSWYAYTPAGVVESDNQSLSDLVNVAETMEGRAVALIPVGNPDLEITKRLPTPCLDVGTKSVSYTIFEGVPLQSQSAYSQTRIYTLKE